MNPYNMTHDTEKPEDFAKEMVKKYIGMRYKKHDDGSITLYMNAWTLLVDIFTLQWLLKGKI